MTPDPVKIYGLFSRPSYENIRFEVASSERSGRNSVAKDEILLRGTLIRPIIPGETVWRVRGEILDDDGPWETARLLELALQLTAPTRSATYVDPWDGVQNVVPLEWSFPRQARQLNHVAFSITFASAELPPGPSAVGAVATSPDELFVGLATLGELLANEPVANAQMEAIRPLFPDLPSTLEGSDYTSAATASLLTATNTSFGGIPGLIQELGNTARSAVTGEFSRDARDQLRADLISEAARSNSPTLLDMREAWALYLSGLGVSAFGVVQSLPGRRLQTVASDRTFDDLARINRDAVRNFRIGETVQV